MENLEFEEIEESEIENNSSIKKSENTLINPKLISQGDIIENRKYQYKILKYLKENSDELYLDEERIKTKVEYEGNPKNDISVLLGYLRKKINISSKEYKELETLYSLEPSKINMILEKFIRMVNEFILNEDSNTKITTDKDISEFIKVKSNINVSKKNMEPYIKEKTIEAYYWSDEEREEEIKIIKKSEIINYWGKNYSLYYEDYAKYEEQLIKEKILKYISFKVYKNEQRIKTFIEKNPIIQEKTLILEELNKDIYRLKLYHIDNTEYYQII